MKNLIAAGQKNWVASFGIYAIVLLAVVRLLVYPLHGAVQDRKAGLEEQRARNAVKTRLIEQAGQAQAAGGPAEAARMRSAVHPQGTPVSAIQVDVLSRIKELAEGRGLSVTGFEMPEAAAGKALTEVPVVVKLKGGAQPLLELLRSIKKEDKTLLVQALEVSAAGQDLTASLTLKALRSER